MSAPSGSLADHFTDFVSEPQATARRIAQVLSDLRPPSPEKGPTVMLMLSHITLSLQQADATLDELLRLKDDDQSSSSSVSSSDSPVRES